MGANRVRLTFNKKEMENLVGSVRTKFSIYESDELKSLLERLVRAEDKFDKGDYENEEQ